MLLFKKIRFYLVWLLALPFIWLFLVVSAIRSGQWKLIGIKVALIHLSLWQRFVRPQPDVKRALFIREIESKLQNRTVNGR